MLPGLPKKGLLLLGELRESVDIALPKVFDDAIMVSIA